MGDPLLDNPRAFVAKVASVIGGTPVSDSSFSGFLSSDFDPFLNHLFTAVSVTPGEVVEAVAGRPAFVWLAEEPTGDAGELAAAGLALVVMHGMTATIEPSGVPGRTDGEIVEVGSLVDVDGWYGVYSGVFGADARGREDWYQVYEALGPLGINHFRCCWRRWTIYLRLPAQRFTRKARSVCTASQLANDAGPRAGISVGPGVPRRGTSTGR